VLVHRAADPPRRSGIPLPPKTAATRAIEHHPRTSRDDARPELAAGIYQKVRARSVRYMRESVIGPTEKSMAKPPEKGSYLADLPETSPTTSSGCDPTSPLSECYVNIVIQPPESAVMPSYKRTSAAPIPCTLSAEDYEFASQCGLVPLAISDVPFNPEAVRTMSLSPQSAQSAQLERILQLLEQDQARVQARVISLRQSIG
jgi:hypothetical protein